MIGKMIGKMVSVAVTSHSIDVHIYTENSWDLIYVVLTRNKEFPCDDAVRPCAASKAAERSQIIWKVN